MEELDKWRRLNDADILTSALARSICFYRERMMKYPNDAWFSDFYKGLYERALHMRTIVDQMVGEMDESYNKEHPE